MIGLLTAAAAAAQSAVTVADEPVSIGARVDCVITKSDPRIGTQRVTFLFLDQARDSEKPVVLVLETDRSGSSALYRRSASSIPPPPANELSSHNRSAPPMFRPVVSIDSPMETLAPATDRGDRWTYRKTSVVTVTDGGGSYTLETDGRCDLVASRGVL